MDNLNIAILLPCFNEEGAIGTTVKQFQEYLPDAKVYVYDNNSSDNTIEEASKAGAIVRTEKRQGKGEVVRRMFSDIDADIYIMCDGDSTYDPSISPYLLNRLVDEDLDMVVGCRSTNNEAYPIGHILGNKIFSNLINFFFNASLSDIFSGYRVMRKRFVKSIPVLSDGFQIETELTVHALNHKFPILEVPTTYKQRPQGTTSKLRTFHDGFKILSFIIFLIRDIKPLLFFSASSLILSMISLFFGIPVIIDFINTGLVERMPTAILSSSIGVISITCLFTGLILDNVSRGRMEKIILSYKSFPSPIVKSSTEHH
ncbi:glycosyltransferase family 2 protein [Vibrio fluvialis]|uniref:glycosyltransferase family 2 protein n=1 Tax=Vibrio fluvialis TaxID=676 RepID=UPI000C22125C|nr:glycosyltransferase family 2 protein [Vibrio fluvialis]MBY7824612.1 glycosyltransferase family 2 protein [Vibrio fluvialis]MBY7883837.1 glycosyltransferase family 2 protein [Vibrio fluvialis]MBY7927067.1 glycosyltransferase family 2 protein [Vibrio fluvialis]MBY8007496.1 glycosyltransferase family 2 protein [Vibrio fluvialis]MBY8071241.1 glycosyltransferase family 2 protein [Vibrio fluvialis]